MIPELLHKLVNLPYFSSTPPKAAGYSDFGLPILEKITTGYMTLRAEDLVRTAVEFSAATIRDAYQRYVLPKFPSLQEIRFSGGGIYNRTHMRRIRELLPELQIEVFDSEFSDAKEALSFALLAHETLFARPGNVIGATGAKKRVILGELAI